MGFLKNAIQRLDFFGVHLMQQINEKDKVQRSFIGGIITFLVFSASLCYSAWVVYKWTTNQISPKIQHAAYLSDFRLLDQNYDVIRFSFWLPDPNFIDPFESNILVPIMTQTKNDTVVSTTLLRLSNQTSRYGNNYLIPKMNVGYENGNNESLLEMYIWLAKCNQSILPEGEQCATDDQIQTFLKQPLNTILVQLNYKEIDSSDKQIKETQQEFYIQVENTFCYTLNIFLQSTLYEINTAVLLEPSSFSEFISGSSVQVQTNSVEYCTLAIGLESYALIYLVLLENQTKTLYDYPHAGDILANIGSIISVLFFVQHLIYFINDNYLENQLFNEIIKIYYPQFENIQVKKNWRGRISKVFYKKRCLEKDEKKQYIQFMDNVRKKVQLKCSFINLQYEISRLYFILRSSKTIEEIKKVHQIGIRLNFCKSEEIVVSSEFRAVKSSSSARWKSSNNYLNDEDFFILTLNDRRQHLKEDYIPDEMQNESNYYDINKI